ncbi:IS630 family transposase [Micromonospora humidisoli]|uniref:IS630 family transposase n=1 Tax=Micromonospora humidisoli TaxID=2807622 RepID=A0ABS2JF73_9ACTN|nr:IS630 family transposase [Micromonospora humidisoli]MBM7085157.1 IS630 family transposase [Micromonospora humidisoli]
MGKGRPKARLVLTDEEREQLTKGARAAHSTQSFAIRCRIVLACAEGATNIEVATRLNVSPATVGKWRSRFAATRLPGLADDPRAGRPRSVRPEQVDGVVAATLDATPAPARRWSRASMATYSGLSASTVGRIWRRFDLRPHLQDGLTLATDPGFVARVVALVGLYRQHPGRTLALCATPRDDRPATGHPVDRGGGPPAAGPPPGYRPVPAAPRPEQLVATAGADPDRPRHAGAYRRFLVTVDRAVPVDLEVHLVADDPAVHDAPAVRGWLTRHPRFHLHLLPAGDSWAGQVHRWSRLLAGRDPAAAGPTPGHPGEPVAHNADGPGPHAAGDATGLTTAARWVAGAEEIHRARVRHHERTSGASTSVEREVSGRLSTLPTGM